MYTDEYQISPAPWSVQLSTGKWADVLDARAQPINVDFDNPANAALTAAAPDLLDALQRVAHCLDSTIEIGPDLTKQIRAAIAKAKRTR